MLVKIILKALLESMATKLDFLNAVGLVIIKFWCKLHRLGQWWLELVVKEEKNNIVK